MEKRVLMNVLFYIKRTKLLKSGEAPIYVKISVGCTRAEMGIGRSVIPMLWNSEKGAMKGTTKESRQLNMFMQTIQFQLREHLSYLLEDNKRITAMAIKDSFLGITDENETLMTLFEEHNENMKKLIDIDFSKETWEKYDRCKRHIKEFLEMKYKRKDISLKEVDHSFISDLETFLKIHKGNSHNTAMKFLANMKKIIRIGMAKGLIRSNPFANIKLPLKKTDRGFLNDAELHAIIKAAFPTSRLAYVRDCFLVSCFTGLAYADLYNLKHEHLVTGSDGKQWIKIKRKKTDVASSIPVLPVVEQIIDRYRNHPACKNNKVLPVLTNQKMNAYLKEIGDVCGIKKNLTTHLARHTFATTVTLNNNVPIESVSKMLGHSSISMTKTYARLLDKKVGQDMEGLYDLYK